MGYTAIFTVPTPPKNIITFPPWFLEKHTANPWQIKHSNPIWNDLPWIRCWFFQQLGTSNLILDETQSLLWMPLIKLDVFPGKRRESHERDEVLFVIINTIRCIATKTIRRDPLHCFKFFETIECSATKQWYVQIIHQKLWEESKTRKLKPKLKQKLKPKIKQTENQIPKVKPDTKTWNQNLKSKRKNKT